MPEALSALYTKMVEEGDILEAPEAETPQVPMDYTWAKKLRMVYKPANFISSIADDCGEWLKPCGVTADRGPATSGAHNTIVTALAGKTASQLSTAACSLSARASAVPWTTTRRCSPRRTTAASTPWPPSTI